MKSGFRVSLGGGMEYFGVTPDLAAFGKAVANGFPIALIAGNKDVMQTVAKNQVFHISTFAGNPVSLAASKACLLYTSPSPRDGLLSRMPSSA